MVVWQNYMMLIYMVVPWFVGTIGAVFLPDAFKLASLIGGLSAPAIVMGAHPTVAKVIARGFKHMWVRIDSDALLWNWTSRIQLWHKPDPALTSTWLPLSEEWQSFMVLHPRHGIRHPYYNNGKRINGIYFKHGWYSVLKSDAGLTTEDKYNLGQWADLFPKRGGWATYWQMLVYLVNSDDAWVTEVVPSVKELEESEEAQLKGLTLLNHIPVVVDGIGYPVLRVEIAAGTMAKRKEWEKAHVMKEPIQKQKVEKPMEVLEVELPTRR